MHWITLTGLDSAGANNVEFDLNAAPIRKLIAGFLRMQDTAKRVSAGDAHSHRSAVILATETAADSITFVGLADGTGVDTGADVSHAGAATANINVPTDSESAHRHTYAEPVYAKVNLDIKDAWAASPDSGDIMLVTQKRIKVYDDLDVEDMIDVLVEYVGEIARP